MDYLVKIPYDLLGYIIDFISFKDYLNVSLVNKYIFNYININHHKILSKLIHSNYYILHMNQKSFNFQRIRNNDNIEGKTMSISKSKNINSLYKAMYLSKLF